MQRLNAEMLKFVISEKKSTKLFGLYYKLIYLCSAIRIIITGSDLSAGGKKR